MSIYKEPAILEPDCEARLRFDVLCSILNRDCVLKHTYIVKDEEYKYEEDKNCTVIIDKDEETEVLSAEQWLSLANNEKHPSDIEAEYFNSSFYKLMVIKNSSKK